MLIIISLIFFQAFKFQQENIKKVQKKESIIVKYYVEELQSFVAEKVNVSDKLLDSEKNCELGVVSEVLTDYSKSYGQNSEGKIVLSSKEGYNSLIITSEIKAAPNTYGFSIDKNNYSIGQSLTINSGKSKFSVIIYDIVKKE